MPILPDPLPPEVQSALQRGNKIEAIKLLRERTGLGLKEAKDIVDAAEAKFAPASGLAPGEIPRSRGSKWLIIVVILLAIAGYYLLR